MHLQKLFPIRQQYVCIRSVRNVIRNFVGNGPFGHPAHAYETSYISKQAWLFNYSTLKAMVQSMNTVSRSTIKSKTLRK